MTRWALLSGPRGTGKSSRAARIARELEGRGLTVGGVVQEAIERDGARVGYVARRVGAAARGAGAADEVVLARKGAPDAGGADVAFCSFVFDSDAFARAREWVALAARDADVVVVDEISKLEVAGQGHHDAVRDALGGRALPLLVVRADQLFGVVERFELDEPVAVLESVDDDALASFVDALARVKAEPR
jgi:nucleoside-triphosphatase THEP1